MNIEFDYYNYPELQTQQTSLLVDLGTPSNSPTGVTTVQDADTGEIDEVNMNEILDDKVNFIFTGVYNDLNGINGASGVLGGFVPYGVLNTGVSIANFYVPQCYAGQSVVQQMDSVVYGTDGIPAKLVIEGTNLAGLPTKYNVGIIPQNDLLKDPNAVTYNSYLNKPRSVIINRDVYAACGLWGTNNYNINDGLGISNDKSGGSISIKQYNEYLTRLNDIFTDVNVGLISEVYSGNYVKQTDGTNLDTNYSFLNRNAKFSQSIIASNQFISNKPTVEWVVPNDKVNSFSMSVKSVFKSQFSSADQLAFEYQQALENYNGAVLKTLYESELRLAKQKILFYQKYTNEPVLGNQYIVNDTALPANLTTTQPVSYGAFLYDKMLAYIMIPVDFGVRKQKYTTKIFGYFKVTRYRYIDMGVRWIRVAFVNSAVASQSRPFVPLNGTLTNVNAPIKTITVNNRIATLTLTSAINYDSENPPTKVVLSGVSDSALNGMFPCKFISSKLIQCELDTLPTNPNIGGGVVLQMVVPFPVLKGPIQPSLVTINYEMPSLPSDAAIRALAFNTYGPWSQYENDPRLYLSREAALNVPAGWTIFPKTSKDIQSMRQGIDIYNKVAFLVKILETQFGAGRVFVSNTTRSFEDQNLLQLGGPSSNFLSWHNYGLAIRILITKGNTSEYIEDGSDDFFLLADVAEAFIEDCRVGAFGTPMNVVWCAQLSTNPDLFDWEFLPIGVEHQDAVKFRNAAYMQMDPVVTNSFINVTQKGWIIPKDGTAPENTPYIRDGSRAYKTATVINGELWVSPSNITNYVPPNNLVLIDVQEFLFLVKNKQSANGTELKSDTTINDWKNKNPVSFNQLIVFYGITGSINLARTLLSGDYIEQFQTIVETLRKENPVKFVQMYLGEYYASAKIIPENATDGTYISLSNGLYTFPLLEAQSTLPGENGNFYGESPVTQDTVEFGNYVDGVFVPLTDSNYKYITSNKPVMTGYVKDSSGNWVASDTGECFVAHDLIAEQIVNRFMEIKNNWETLKSGIMYDDVFDSQNTEQIDLMENEFGVISVQDIIPISKLRDMYTRFLVNSTDRWPDQGVRGVGDDLQVFEKLITNAELSGVYKVKLTKEKPQIEPLRNVNHIENIVETIYKVKVPKVSDIL